MKDLKNLKGAKMLSKKEQQSIKGGIAPCGADGWCPIGYICVEGPVGEFCVRG